MKLKLCCLALLSSCVQMFALDKIDNLSSFAKIYGIVRYYSPNPYTQAWDETDWFKVAYRYVRSYSESDCDESVLYDFLNVFAPNATLTAEPDSVYSREISSPFYFNEYVGSGNMGYSLSASNASETSEEALCSGLKELKPGIPAPKAAFRYSYPLDNGSWFNMPVAEHKEAFDKHLVDSAHRNADRDWDRLLGKGMDMRFKTINAFRDKNYRLADMLVRWNIIRHFYIYHDEDHTDWDARLAPMLQAAVDFPDDRRGRTVCYEYYELLLRLMNPIRDAHFILDTSMELSRALGFYLVRYYSPIELEIVGDKVLITSSDPGVELNLSAGNELLSVDGVDIETFIENNLCYVNTSDDIDAKSKALLHGLSSFESGAAVCVTSMTAAGDTVKDTLHLNRTSPYAVSDKLSPYHIEDGIAYFNPSGLRKSYDSFSEMMKRENEFSSIIFDLRQYPSYDFAEEVLGHFADEDMVVSENMLLPVSYLPYQSGMYYVSEPEYVRHKSKIDKTCVFLSDYTTVSYAETVLMIVEAYGFGTIVGRPTRGTNGDATRFMLPAFGFTMTGLKAVNFDGSRHHGIGVVPDILVEQASVDCAREGSDLILERAKQYLKGEL